MSSKQLAKQKQYEQLEKGEKLSETTSDTRGRAFDWTDQFSRLDCPYLILFEWKISSAPLID